MECKKSGHSINQRKCHNNWPKYPCYSPRDRACYNTDGTEQYFDPVSDTIDAVTSGYLSIYDYFFNKLVERGMPPSEAREIAIRERMRDHVPFGATSIVPNAARRYIPERFERRIHPATAVEYRAQHPLLNASENVGPGLRYSLSRNLKDMGVSLYDNTVGRCRRRHQGRHPSPVELRRQPSQEHKEGHGKRGTKRAKPKNPKRAKRAKQTAKHSAKHAKQTAKHTAKHAKRSAKHAAKHAKRSAKHAAKHAKHAKHAAKHAKRAKQTAKRAT